MPRDPSSSASILAAIARPGRSPLETLMSGHGDLTEKESTKPMEPVAGSTGAAVRASRRAPRKTDSNELRHC